MAVLAVEYFLSEKGERHYLRTQGDTIDNTRVQLIIDKASPYYDQLCEHVDLFSLIFDCVYPGNQKSLTVVAKSPSTPYTVRLTDDDGIYIESDCYFERPDECPGLMEGLLLALDTKKLLRESKETEQAYLTTLPFETVVTVHDRYLDGSFLELRNELEEGTYRTLDVRYKWTAKSVHALLEKLGWNTFDYAFDWPWDYLQKKYGRQNQEILTELYLAGDFARGNIEARSFGMNSFDSHGFANSVLRLPNKEAFVALKSRLEEQDQRRDGFIKNEGSSYLRCLVKDQKNYEHILEREILTKKYPKGFLFKHYSNQVYKSRNCPTASEYSHLRYINEAYPDLSNPRFKWLEVGDQDLVTWAGPVVILQSPYGFDVLFADFSQDDLDYPLKSTQAPYAEQEMSKANELVYRPRDPVYAPF